MGRIQGNGFTVPVYLGHHVILTVFEGVNLLDVGAFPWWIGRV